MLASQIFVKSAARVDGFVLLVAHVIIVSQARCVWQAQPKSTCAFPQAVAGFLVMPNAASPSTTDYSQVRTAVAEFHQAAAELHAAIEDFANARGSRNKFARTRERVSNALADLKGPLRTFAELGTSDETSTRSDASADALASLASARSLFRGIKRIAHQIYTRQISRDTIESLGTCIAGLGDELDKLSDLLGLPDSERH